MFLNSTFQYSLVVLIPATFMKLLFHLVPITSSLIIKFIVGECFLFFQFIQCQYLSFPVLFPTPEMTSLFFPIFGMLDVAELSSLTFLFPSLLSLWVI